MNSEKKKKKYDLWVILTIFGIFNTVLFYYAGIKSKSKKYIHIGHFYLFLIFISFFIDSGIPFISNVIFGLYFAGYIFGIVFSIKTLPAFYKRLSLLKYIDYNTLHNKKVYLMDNRALEELADKDSLVYLNNNIKISPFTISDDSIFGTFTENEDEYLEYTGEKIKINSDSEEILSTLPFITNELIRKIVLERKLGSGFRNENDIKNKLGLNDRNAKILTKRIDFSFENQK